MHFQVAVDVMPKSEISDPQGLTIERALPRLGFGSISGVRVGKHMTFSVDAADQEEAEEIVRKACESFLTNPIIEEYEVQMRSVAEASR